MLTICRRPHRPLAALLVLVAAWPASADVLLADRSVEADAGLSDDNRLTDAGTGVFTGDVFESNFLGGQENNEGVASAIQISTLADNGSFTGTINLFAQNFGPAGPGAFAMGDFDYEFSVEEPTAYVADVDVTFFDSFGAGSRFDFDVLRLLPEGGTETVFSFFSDSTGTGVLEPGTYRVLGTGVAEAFDADSDSSLTATVSFTVPEPSSLALLASAGLGLMRRRRAWRG